MKDLTKFSAIFLASTIFCGICISCITQFLGSPKRLFSALVFHWIEEMMNLHIELRLHLFFIHFLRQLRQNQRKNQ